MLTLDGLAFTVGRALYRDHPEEHAETTAKVHVKVQLGEAIHLAQLDTGAAYSVLSPEVAETLELETLQTDLSMPTPRDQKTGPLVRTLATLVADTGASLDLQAVFFVPADWGAGLFIGYTGFIEFIRLGLDPQNNQFYFGPAN